MKEIQDKAIDQIISFFEWYLKETDKENIKTLARNLYDSAPSSALVDQEVLNAYGQLFPLAYPSVNTRIQPPSEQEIKHLIVRLKKKRKQELTADGRP